MNRVEPKLSIIAPAERRARATIRCFRISGASWSFGYSWQIPGSAEGLVREAEAEAALPAVQADVIAYRTDDPAQFGLGYLRPDERRSGQVAAIAFAAQMAKQHKRNAIGLFAVEGYYWLVSIKEDAIPPNNGDRLFDDRVEAIAAFSALYNRPDHDWQRIYLPAELLLSDQPSDRHVAPDIIDAIGDRLSTGSLVDFLDGQKSAFARQRGLRRHDVRTLLGDRRLRLGLAIIALLLVGKWVALPLYRRLTAPPPKPSVAIVQHPLVEPPPVPPPPPPPRIASEPVAVVEPLPPEMAEHCVDAIAGLVDRAPLGWQVGRVECAWTGVTISLKRHFGAIDAVAAAYPGASITFDDRYAATDVHLPFAHKANYHTLTLWPAEQVRRALVTTGWHVGENPILSPFEAPKGRATDDPAIWTQASFIITSAMLPNRWARELAAIPGATITGVAADAQAMIATPASFKWEIKGMLYAQ